jgi:3-phenylpropionate/cinnamic acid dioxygenase small subunit
MSDAETLFRLSGLNAAYAAAIDADRLEDWPGFFTEKCLYKVTSADNEAKGYAAGIIFADSQAMLRDRVQSLRVANIYERQRYRHIVGMPVLGAEAGTSETSFMIVRTMRDGKMELFAAGVYRDRTVVSADGGLRYAERVVVCDSGRFDTLVAIPL